MKFRHNCYWKGPRLPHGTTSVDYNTRCTDCGKHWRVTQRSGSMDAVRISSFIPNIRFWLWNRRMTRQSKELSS